MSIAIEGTFEEVEGLVYQWSYIFYCKYGGEYSEWLSDASVIFMEAYNSFDASKGAKFTSWLVYKLRRQLYERVRNKQRSSGQYQNKLIQKIKEDISTGRIPLCRTRSFNLNSFIQDISEDARVIVGLIFEIPFDIKLSLAEQSKTVKISDRFKNSLREFLVDMGWHELRINSTFNEIKEALK